MFFDLVRRNSRRSRKENGLFFVSLLVSIVSFYIILSLAEQDVMVFLRKMESDAVDKLMALIPAFYGVTLFILFFLVYFASKYQLERRSHELGVYLMLGMRRTKLFLLLMAEDLWSSVLSLALGLADEIQSYAGGIRMDSMFVDGWWESASWVISRYFLWKRLG